MQITVNRSDLIRAVSITRKALPKVVIQQERGHLLVSVSDGVMVITGTNNDLKARCVISVKPKDARLSFTCDPKIASSVLSKIDLPEVVLEYDDVDQSTKVFTSDGATSFAKLQSFPSSMMLTFEPSASRSSVPVPKSVLSMALEYSTHYLSPPKEDSRNFDIVSISKGVLYAANGSNMMGFLVSSSFKELEDIRLRKAVVPIMSQILDSLEDETVGLFQTTSDSGIETSNGTYFSCLKPTLDPPSVPTQNIKSDGPYTLVDRSTLAKHLERLVSSHTGPHDVIGICMTLRGSGDSSFIDLSLLSSKSVERIACSRVGDPSSDDVTHFVEYKILKSILNSFEHGGNVRLHINGKHDKFFKAYDKVTTGKEVSVLVGIGGYAKVSNIG